MSAQTDSDTADYRSLEEIANNDPDTEDKVRYPLYWVEDDESPKEVMDTAIMNLLDSFARDQYEPEDIVAIVSDYGDADGKSAASTLLYKYRDTDKCPIYVPAGHRGNCPDTITTLERVTSILSGATVYFTDIAPNDDKTEEYIDALTAVAEENDLRVRDHHPWPDEVIEAVEPVADDFVVDDSQGDDQVCATEIVAREDFEDTPEMIEELAHVTGIRDLWKKEQFEDYPEGEALVDFAFWASYGEFTSLVSEHGLGFVDEGEDTVQEFLDHREEKNAKIELAADRAEWHEIGGLDVAIAYGGVYNSGLGDVLRERGADVVGIVSPAGKFSFRSRDEHPVCEEIAKEFGGGGHPPAAGASPGIAVSREDYEDADEDEKDELVTYRDHWESWGEFAREYMLDGMTKVLTSDDIEDVYENVALDE